jgi:hypothetical protein
MKPGDEMISSNSAVHNVERQVRLTGEIAHSAYQNLGILKIDVPDSRRKIDPRHEA